MIGDEDIWKGEWTRAFKWSVLRGAIETSEKTLVKFIINAIVQIEKKKEQGNAESQVLHLLVSDSGVSSELLVCWRVIMGSSGSMRKHSASSQKI